ncbi:hypothetical protein BTI06_08960 [Lactobacillus delbrueckii subsp. bulgaricus]|nr:hypothetical protein [Lactobacillus delbrueckii subsp. bulgaricus]
MVIGVIVVTFNRLNMLKVALKSFDEQTCKPGYIVVVNNASTDKTPEYLDGWKKDQKNYKKYVITTEKNLGGSGGFYTGLEFAQKLNCDWIWVSDDDAFPEHDALENAQNYLKNRDTSNISAICGEVINQGKIDTGHRRNYERRGLNIVTTNIPVEYYSKKEFEITAFSYVGAIINKEKLKEVGLTPKDYFIWYDDTEHSLRLHKVGKIICVPSVKVHHDVGKESTDLNWKVYYGIRNQADMYRRHFPKKCYYYYCYSGLIKASINDLLGRHREYNKVTRKAIYDAMHNKFGVDALYKPGWKPQNR